MKSGDTMCFLRTVLWTPTSPNFAGTSNPTRPVLDTSSPFAGSVPALTDENDTKPSRSQQISHTRPRYCVEPEDKFHVQTVDRIHHGDTGGAFTQYRRSTEQTGRYRPAGRHPNANSRRPEGGDSEIR